MVADEPQMNLGVVSVGAPPYLVVHNKTIWGAMQYTPSQARQAVGISQETLRHWRSALSSLAGIRGHAPAFRPGQLLGLAVVRRLVEDIGLSVSSLKLAERDIFEICSSPQWLRLARGYLIVRPSQGSTRFVDEVTDEAAKHACVILPLEPIVVALREALLEVTPEEEQPSLAFPPVGLPEERTTTAGGARS